ncbi:MAG TPA: 3-deoxy-8-phosphooctulonate synthase [bacterium]|nr:3-deoxy-8-phosphooctulonate synthase [bacterium]
MTGKRGSARKTAKAREKSSDNIFKGFFFIGGPCVIEDEKTVMHTAEKLKEITSFLSVPFVFKASYDKANRSSSKSYRGAGLAQGLKILEKVKRKFKVPVLTDVHSAQEAKEAGRTADIIQIPAFLCRQTDILAAAAKTGRMVNVKKGQFLSPYEVKNIIEKLTSAGNNRILLTERGFSFGYNNLVVDMKSIAIMKKTGYPVIIDATHAVQKPGGAGDRSGGEREFVEAIAKGAVAAGANGLFLEVHPDPKNALSDKETQYPLDSVMTLLYKVKEVYEAVN